MMDGFDISINNQTNNMGEGWKTLPERRKYG